MTTNGANTMTNQKATDKINNIMKPNHLTMIEFIDADTGDFATIEKNATTGWYAISYLGYFDRNIKVEETA